MASFGPAVELVFRHEGGFVNNPSDPGGATKYGITLAVLAEWRKKPCTADDVLKMPDTEAKDIYKAKYWNAVQGDSIQNQNIANWCFDMAVLRGVDGACKTMQAALGVAQDGAVGSKTILALNQANAAMFLNVFRSLCVKKFVVIAQARPASLQFLPGWVRRAEEMADDVSLLLQKTSSLVASAGAPLVLSTK